MTMQIGNGGMKSNYVNEAKECVAITFPANPNTPMFRKTNYPFTFWHKFVMRCYLNPELGAHMIMGNTAEGQDILQGVTAEEVTEGFLRNLNEDELNQMAEVYGVKPCKNPKATVMKILGAKEDGTKPKLKAVVGGV